MNNSLICTHSGVFHADDVLGAVILKEAGIIESFRQITRTRDPKVIAAAELCFDVGGIYDSASRRFDHHQKGGKGPDSKCWHEEGYSMSSAGLLWSLYGYRIAEENMEVFEEVRKSFVKHIDLVDVGESKLNFDDALTISHVISNLNPTWDEKYQDFDSAFIEACEIMERVFKAEIKRAEAKFKAKSIVEGVSAWDGILILEQFCPWQDWIHGHVHIDSIKFVIHPSPDKTWMVYQVPKTKGSFEGKVQLPEAWAGLRDQQLAAITGVEDAVFVHVGRFCGGAKTMEGAVRMAQLATGMV